MDKLLHDIIEGYGSEEEIKNVKHISFLETNED